MSTEQFRKSFQKFEAIRLAYQSKNKGRFKRMFLRTSLIILAVLLSISLLVSGTLVIENIFLIIPSMLLGAIVGFIIKSIAAGSDMTKIENAFNEHVLQSILSSGKTNLLLVSEDELTSAFQNGYGQKNRFEQFEFPYRSLLLKSEHASHKVFVMIHRETKNIRLFQVKSHQLKKSIMCFNNEFVERWKTAHRKNRPVSVIENPRELDFKNRNSYSFSAYTSTSSINERYLSIDKLNHLENFFQKGSHDVALEIAPNVISVKHYLPANEDLFSLAFISNASGSNLFSPKAKEEIDESFLSKLQEHVTIIDELVEDLSGLTLESGR